MPLVICSNCQQNLNAPDHLAGRQVKCPKCQGIFVVPPVSQSNPQSQPLGHSAQPTPDTAGSLFDSYPNSGMPNPTMPNPTMPNPTMQYQGVPTQSKQSSSNPYEKLNTGIKLVLLSLIVSFASMLFGLLFSFLSSEVNDVFSIIGKLNRLVGLAGSGLGIAGLVFCLYVPEKTGARPLAIGALSCVAAKAIIVEIILTLTGLFGVQSGLMMTGMILASLLPLAMAILFLLFLRKVSEFKKLHFAVEELDILIKIMFIIIVAGMAGQFVFGLIPYGSYLFLIAMAGAQGYWVFRLANLLNRLEFQRS